MFESIKELLRPPAKQSIIVSSPSNYEDLPQGFFTCETACGRTTLGYNGSFVAWECGTTVVDGGKRITLDVPRESLPVVKLNFTRQTQGFQHIGGNTVVDTTMLDGDPEPVSWEGTSPLGSDGSWV